MSLLHDFRQACRGALRAPGFFGAAMLSLALGVGGVTAFFGLARHFLLRPLPYAAPERLVALSETRAVGGEVKDIPMGPSDFQAWREEAGALERVALFRPRSLVVDAGDGEPTMEPAAQASEGFFETLGLRPLLGRFFLREDEAPGQPGRVVLSRAFWRERFGSDPSILGRTLLMAGNPFQIVGVAPDFAFPTRFGEETPRFFVVLTLRDDLKARTVHMYEGVGRLRAGVTPAQALAELEAIQSRRTLLFPDTNAGNGARLEDFRVHLYGARSRSLGFLTGVAGLLLLMACLNSAGLFLARGLVKTRESALRAALGAGIRHLFAPFLAEGCVTAIGGAVGGLLLAQALFRLLPRLLKEAVPVPGGATPTLDWGLLGFALLLSLLASLAVSALPVLRSRGADLLPALQEGTRGTRRGGNLRGALLAGEVALAVVLLAGTGLLLHSMGRLLNRPLGFQPRGLVGFHVDVNTPVLRQQAHMEAFRRVLLERVRALPGVQEAGVADHGPVTPLRTTSRIRLGASEAPLASDPEVPVFSASEGYFEALGVRLLEGRALAASDVPGAPAVAVVNRAFARRFFPGGGAVGRVLRTSYLDDPMQIVGVVEDQRAGGPEGEVQAVLVYSVAQNLNGDFGVYLRTRRSPQSLRAELEAAVRAADPSRRPRQVFRIEDQIRESLAERRNLVWLLGAFTSLALALAAVGIYGITAYAVAQRRREIGVRLALGGARAVVVGGILKRELAFVASGACLGLAASLALGRALRSQLVDIQASDPGALLGAAACLALVGALAGLFPSLRAARVAPAEALRSE